MGIADDARKRIDERVAGALAADARRQEHAAQARLLIDEFLGIVRSRGISPALIFHAEEGPADLQGRRQVWAGECIGSGWDLQSLVHGDSGSRSFFLFSDGHLTIDLGKRVVKDGVGARVRVGTRGADITTNVPLDLLRESMVEFVASNDSARQSGLWTRPSDYVDRRHGSE